MGSIDLTVLDKIQTILVDVDDVGGLGSVTNVSKTEYLIGNPYPLAIDVHEFIDDNKGAIRASQFISFYGENTGLQEGTELPTRYLPVGQGFIVEIEDDSDLPFNGTVKFNNSQRIFIKESDADGLDDQKRLCIFKISKRKILKSDCFKIK